jgi:exonuclease SbcD
MTIKVIHTSDWHLGKKLFKRSRIEEQSLFLSWLEEYIKEEGINILLISGDIFDTPTPPNEALALYFNFLNKISENKDFHTVIISGNHDSASFIEAPAAFLNKHNIHIRTQISPDMKENIITINGEKRNIEIKTLPYFRSYDLFNSIETESTELSQEQIKDFLNSYIDSWLTESSETKPYRIVMAHHAFGEFSATGSEHTLHLAGLDSLSTDWAEDSFDYMALGHIHSTQKIDKDKNIYYSGAPIPLRFSEKQKKNIIQININENKEEILKIQIPTFRNISQITGNKADILNKIKEECLKLDEKKVNLSSFIEIILNLDEPDNNFIDQIVNLIKENEAELLSLVPIYRSSSELIEDTLDKKNINDLAIEEIFQEYYKIKHPDSNSIPKHIESHFHSILEDIYHEDS